MVVDASKTGKEKFQRRSLVIEIIGPAGAGKSTLFTALGNVDSEIYKESLPPVWKISYTLFFAKNILLLTPTFINLLRIGQRYLSRREIAWMAILNGWPEILKKKVNQDEKCILLDQGPIFLMAILSGFGPSGLHHSTIKGWWEKLYLNWSQTLDIIVWLDSSDVTLTRRIRDRDAPHIIKGETDLEVREFLAKYRMIYESTVKQLVARNPEMRVVKYDTGQNSLDVIVQKVISEIECITKLS